MGQKTVFLNGEGDQWHLRNHGKPYNNIRNDIIVDNIQDANDIMEVGCGNGKYLADLVDYYNAGGLGVEPSELAITDGRAMFREVEFLNGTALDPSLIRDGSVDLLIYGFCLYLCDRQDLHEIVHVGDQMLRDKGHLVIHDFDPEHPHKVPYRHVDGLFSYKMDHSKLWLANPSYSLVSKTVIDDGTAVWILKKDIAAGWPLEITE